MKPKRKEPIDLNKDDNEIHRFELITSMLNDFPKTREQIIRWLVNSYSVEMSLAVQKPKT